VTRTPGKFERLCAERHARELALAAQPGGHPKGFAFDAAAGERVVRFVESFCRHSKGEWAGKLLVLEEWQRELVRQAFGWKRRDGTRRFRCLYWEMPRKNAKSTLGSAIGLYLLVADDESGAEVYSSATMRDQARIVWSAAAAMVKASPELRRFVKAQRNNLSCEKLGSKFEPLSADSSTLDGLNPHGNIVDELHAHKTRGVWDVLDTAMGARRQPLTLAITTAGTYEPESIGWQLHNAACQVLEGAYEDDALHAFIACADEGDDYFSAETQAKANPNFGVSVKPDYLARQAEKAKHEPSFLNEYLRLHLNVWTQQVTRWLSLDAWNACEPELLPGVDVRAFALEREKSLEGRSCFGGLELSTKLNLSALVLAFVGADGTADAVCRFWLPASTAERLEKQGQRQFATWAREGWLTLTPGDVVDYEFIRREVSALAKRYAVREVAFDPYGATDLSTRLQGDGLAMVEVRQGYRSLSEPSKDLEGRVVSGKLRHAGNPVLRYCVGNAAVSLDAAGNVKPDKAKSSGRIDGVVALVMALSRVIGGKPEPKSVYETRGLLVL